MIFLSRLSQRLQINKYKLYAIFATDDVMSLNDRDYRYLIYFRLPAGKPMQRRGRRTWALPAPLQPVHTLSTGRIYLGIVVHRFRASAVPARLRDAGHIRQHH